MRRRRVVVVEDDPLQAQSIIEALRAMLPEVRIDRLATESSFCAALPDLAREPPDAIVMDVMLRWADPGPSMPIPPDDVLKKGFYRAGIRCVHRLTEQIETWDVPVVLYTVLSDSEDLAGEIQESPRNVTYVPKTDNTELLADHVRRRISASN